MKAGLAPYEALKAATSNPADLLGEGGDPSFGRLQPGARADLLMLAEDPLASVSALRSMDGALVRGRWLGRDELDQMLEAATRSFAR